MLSKRQATVIGDDHVIEHADVHQLQGFAQPARDQLVGVTGFGDAGRMVMRQDDRRGIARQRLLHDLARMHAGAVDSAAEQLIESDQPMPVVQVQAAYLYFQDKAGQARHNSRINSGKVGKLEGRGQP